MTYRANAVLYTSLIALSAVVVVSSVTLTTWMQDISGRLLSRMAVRDNIPEETIIGGVAGAEAYAYQTIPPPLPVYRPADERLPSQMPRPEAPYDTYAYADPADAYRTAASLTENTDDMIRDLLAQADSGNMEASSTRSSDALALQASILEDMRRTSQPLAAADIPPQ